ncbi:MAG: hypothetical protein COX57_05685 [Alphaproteobacteria bacterium CG_4_10_14_0_2_um_filter_63_37]|nr:MAG: hypothetical protein COX57_05685 [Alphaproteobacteria bacterium CG_4_10_14_0_2_um_filter_63_37]
MDPVWKSTMMILSGVGAAVVVAAANIGDPEYENRIYHPVQGQGSHSENIVSGSSANLGVLHGMLHLDRLVLHVDKPFKSITLHARAYRGNLVFGDKILTSVENIYPSEERLIYNILSSIIIPSNEELSSIEGHEDPIMAEIYAVVDGREVVVYTGQLVPRTSS